MMREFEIERQFNIKIETMKPNKGVYHLNTNKGERCLKKINFGIQKLEFVYGAKEHLINNGFKSVDKYFMNIDNEPYAMVNEDLYTLSEWIEGRECDFTSMDDINLAANKLAQLHECSKGYDPPENSKLKSDLGRWINLMEKRTKALDKMRDMARKKHNKQQYDLDYLGNVDFYKRLAFRGLNVLKTSDYLDLCEKAENEKIFCHHDYTHHNIIIDKNNNINVIDFDYCKREVRAYDIANFITKVCKKNGWNIEYANKIIQEYDKVSKIQENEYRVIFAYLLFPQRFWRLANRYYYNEVTWAQNTFTKKMGNMLAEQEKYIKFIDEFKTIYNQEE